MPQITNIHTGTNGTGSTTSVPNPWRPVIAIIVGLVFLLIVLALLLFAVRYQKANMQIEYRTVPHALRDVSDVQGGWVTM